LRRYETIFITYADLPDEETAALIDRYSGIVKDQRGKLIKIEKWGKRKLAYEIKKQSRGNYVLFDFAGGSDVVVELERNLRIGDKVLKYMTVKTKDAITLQEVEKEIADNAASSKVEEAAPVAPEAPKATEEVTTATPEGENVAPAETVNEEKE